MEHTLPRHYKDKVLIGSMNIFLMRLIAITANHNDSESFSHLNRYKDNWLFDTNAGAPFTDKGEF